jgi:hypothetical protein
MLFMGFLEKTELDTSVGQHVKNNFDQFEQLCTFAIYAIDFKDMHLLWIII